MPAMTVIATKVRKTAMRNKVFDCSLAESYGGCYTIVSVWDSC